MLLHMDCAMLSPSQSGSVFSKAVEEAQATCKPGETPDQSEIPEGGRGIFDSPKVIAA